MNTAQALLEKYKVEINKHKFETIEPLISKDCKFWFSSGNRIFSHHIINLGSTATRKAPKSPIIQRSQKLANRLDIIKKIQFIHALTENRFSPS